LREALVWACGIIRRKSAGLERGFLCGYTCCVGAQW
jgi:hypothetical protein